MADGDWDSERQKALYKEARSVIEAQSETISDIDNKAMRSVRLTVILIGILIAALDFQSELFHERALTIGILLLVASVIIGIVTYSESDEFLGSNGDYLIDLENDNFDEDTWGEDLLATYSGMISENHEDIQRNGTLFTATLILLVLGICSATASVLLS